MTTTSRFVRDCQRARLIPAFVPTDPMTGPGVGVDRRGRAHLQFATGFKHIGKESAGFWLKQCLKWSRGTVRLYPQGIAALLDPEGGL